jgi:hypothetical protein
LPRRFGQQPQQQHLQPEAGIDALAQLLFAALELGLPAQQLGGADALGQLRQLAAELGRKTTELQPIWRHAGQHQIPQQPRQSL